MPSLATFKTVSWIILQNILSRSAWNILSSSWTLIRPNSTDLPNGKFDDAVTAVVEEEQSGGEEISEKAVSCLAEEESGAGNGDTEATDISVSI